MIIAARVIHVVLGVFWAGTLFFMVVLLEPSVRSVGPDGGKVMRALQNRGLMTVLPVAAALTILSGGYLYWRMLSGFGLAWAHTPFGMALGIGGIASLIAFVQGVFFLRPTSILTGKLGATVAEATDEARRETLKLEIAGLKARSRLHSRWIALWLAVATLTMAVARYL